MAISVEVWGGWACFSRPEFKTERVTFDVITPSAARGILEAVFWHPGMKYIVDRIHVCAPIRFTNLRRNEVKDVVSADKVRTAMSRGSADGLYLSTANSIQQRAALLLRDVRYVIDAHFDLVPEKMSPSDNAGKFQDIVRRRLEKGQCYHQPYLGCREFPARFKPCTELPPCPDELLGEKDLGWMLYDMDYTDPSDIRPKFFRAVLRDGVLEVPPPDSEEVRG